jgi:hypothetical protein
METMSKQSYKVERTLPDSQRVLIGIFEGVSEARKRVAAFSEYWPGDYVIVPRDYERRAHRQGWQNSISSLPSQVIRPF